KQFPTIKSSFIDDITSLSRDGKALVSVYQNFADDTVRVWDLTRGNEASTVVVPTWRSDQSRSRVNALSPDGALCAARTPKQIHIFDTATGKELWVFPHADDTVVALTFAGSNQLVSADKEQKITIWDARTGKSLRQFSHGAPVGLLMASVDGLRLA